MGEDSLHECTEFDQLNTCVECGAGALTSPLSDEDYKREMKKLGGR